MTSQRQARRRLVVAAGCGLLCAVLAGCGSVAASTSASGPSASTPAGGAAAPLVGCASVNEATMVTISRLGHLVAPAAAGSVLVADRQPALVRAMFRDFCDAVAHPDLAVGVLHCPADMGAGYTGVFYDGDRVLARYTYAASGCQRVGITVGSTTRSTTVAGQAASAAPHLAADFAAALNSAKAGAAAQPGASAGPGAGKAPSPSGVNPGGPNVPA